MKKKNRIYKYIAHLLFTMFVLLVALSTSIAQEEAEKKTDLRPVKKTFESNWLIDNQTVIVPVKSTFEWDIMHRFGPVTNGYDDFWGFFAPSNFRLGFSYVPINDLQIGFGFTKDKLLWDFNAKYALLKQRRVGGMPFSMTYFVNVAIDTRDESNFRKSGDRYSYFHQVMFARKINKEFSVQASASLSHFNVVFRDEIESSARMEHDHLAVSLMGKYKISGSLSIIANYDQPLTDHFAHDPKPNLSLGIEVVSSSHAFQVFVGRYKAIVPQYNNVFNLNEDLLIGFNITRLWNF